MNTITQFKPTAQRRLAAGQERPQRRAAAGKPVRRPRLTQAVNFFAGAGSAPFFWRLIFGKY